MLTDMWNEFSAMRAEELRCIAAHQRLAGAASPHHAVSPRQRLGRRLIHLGAAMAGERVWFVPRDL
jgi:hypothetical protein